MWLLILIRLLLTKMNHRAFARKYRPNNLKDVVGQNRITIPLTNALDNDKLHHAYLFSGTRGVGKTTIARILVKCLNCEQGPSSHPCDTCENCKACDAGTFIDFIEMDAASHSKVEEIRDLLEQVHFLPTKNKKKVILLDEIHMLSKHSFNALLKTLEEPPNHILFIFATTEIESVPDTIKSRCIVFYLDKIPNEIIVSNLKKVSKLESIKIDEESLRDIALYSRGSVRDSLSIFENAAAAGDGTIDSKVVKSILGSSADSIIAHFFQAIINQDKQALVAGERELNNYSGEIAKVLDQFIYLLQKSAYQSFVSGIDGNQLSSPSHKIIQIMIQIAIEARTHFSYHPDPHTAVINTIIRMMLFTDNQISRSEQDKISASVLSQLDAKLISVQTK